jgi:hypothetical protein
MNRWLTLLVAAACTALGCADSPTTGPSSGEGASIAASSVPATSSALVGGSTNASAASQSNPNGVGGSMPAYYDGEKFLINFKELPPGGESSVLVHNGSINTIYMSDGCMPGGQMFVSVLDAIQGDGFNPLWNEVQVVFNRSAPCQQYTSDNAILAAAAAHQITLRPTDEVYRCAVIGKK